MQRLPGAKTQSLGTCRPRRNLRRFFPQGYGYPRAPHWVRELAAGPDVDVVVCATQPPEAGARFVSMAIEAGKHVVIVDKEADSVVGPILKYKADRAGVVYTTDDGNEPGLLMGMCGWARTLGFEVLTGGITHGPEYDPQSGIAVAKGSRIEFPHDVRWAMEPMGPGSEAEAVIATREQILSRLRPRMECGDPTCHLAVAANGTGILPDTPTGRRPYVYIREIAEILIPREMGGIHSTRNVVEIPLYGGNVFIVARSGSRKTMRTPGSQRCAREYRRQRGYTSAPLPPLRSRDSGTV